MRILLLADIHANWPALQAIEEPHELCIFLGDLVEYCLEPTPCIDWVREYAHYAIRGNHDHGAAQNVTIQSTTGYPYLTGLTRALTRQQLGLENLRFLSGLPVTKTMTLDDKQFLLVHGTPRDPLDEYGLANADYWARRLEQVEADVVCVGHTHQPYVLEIGDKVVINPGSVGMPRDGDPRASYAVIEDGQIELKRSAYPVEDTVRTIAQSALPDTAKKMLAQVLRNGGAKK